MDLFDFEELDYRLDVRERRFADISNVSRLFDSLFDTDQVRLVLVLTEHARLELTHLCLQFLLRFFQCFRQEALLA